MLAMGIALWAASGAPLVVDGVWMGGMAAQSAADSSRIALLIFQAQATQDAAAKATDAAVIALRRQLDASRAALGVARQQLGATRRERDRAQAAARQVDELEARVAQLTLDFTATLAQHDDQYRREREQLVAAADRLLATPDGRRALDLFNAGDAAGWSEAKLVLEELRRTRRAADTRAVAQLYVQKVEAGQEKRANAVRLFEEIARDGAAEANDLLTLSALYGSEHRLTAASSAAERAFALANDDGVKLQAAIFSISSLVAAARPAEARRYVDAGEPLLARLQRTEPANLATVMYSANYDSAVALYFEAIGRPGDALAWRRKVVALWGRMAAAFPAVSPFQSFRAAALTEQARLRAITGDDRGALADYRQAGRDAEAANAASLPDVSARLAIARLELKGKRPADALRSVSPLLPRLRQRADAVGSQAEIDELIGALVVASDAHYELHDPAAATALLEEALAAALRMRAHAPDSAIANYHVMMQRQRLASIGAPGHGWTAVVADIDAMARAGMIGAADLKALEPLRARAAAEARR